MPDTPSITLVKEFDYRGVPEEWSNTYHFNGDTPTTEAEWKALALDIYETERAIYVPAVTLVAAYGYEAGNEVSVAQIDFRVGSPTRPAGTLTIGSNYALAGDQAVTARARIGTSSTGKKVYIRKYWHGAAASSAGTGDNVASAVTAAMNAHLTAALGGGWDGGATWCGPQGQDATEPLASPYVTTRTLKRRGKRP